MMRWPMPTRRTGRHDICLRRCASKVKVLLQRDGATLAVEDCLHRADELARRQGALFWELRVGLSLARMRISQGRTEEAKRPLAAIYDRFTEGFDTPYLRAAKALLTEMAQIDCRSFEVPGTAVHCAGAGFGPLTPFGCTQGHRRVSARLSVVSRRGNGRLRVYRPFVRSVFAEDSAAPVAPDDRDAAPRPGDRA
jgi:hypothetical protein